MPASQEQKVDFLLKKIGYSASKTGVAEDESTIGLSTNTAKKPFEEGIASPLVIPSTTILSDSSFIPTTPPGSDTLYVKGYRTATALRMTRDSTVGTNTRTYIAYTTYNDTSSARLTNWIDTQFGSSYIVKVFKGDPNSSGVELQQAGGNAGTDGWFFDYSSGVLNFNGINLPDGVTATNIYIVGYRYIGATGVQPPAGIGTFHDLIVHNNFSVAGVSTFTGNIDADAFVIAGSTGTGGIKVGTSLQIFDASHTAIRQQNTGSIFIDADNIELRNRSGGGYRAYAKFGSWASGAAGLFHDDGSNSNERLRTTSSGITVTGTTDTDNFINAGVSTFVGIITASAVGNVIPFLFNNYSDLPSASSYHGAFAHVHGYGKGYFAHAGNWMELVNKETTGIVGTGTERYNIGYLDATNLYVSGITTLGSIGISTGLISGPAITYIDPATVGDDTGTLVVKGNLQVEGTQTTVNSSTMTVTDKNIELAKGAANDAAADGGGITVESGGGNKTWQWLDATDSWTSSEHIRIPDDKVFGFATDTNTHIGRPAADTIAFTNGGSERLRITSDGYLQFNNADSRVHTNADTSLLRFNGGSSNSVSNGAAFTLTGRNYSGGNYADLSSATGGHLQFRIGTTEALRITNSTSVGIGSTQPQAKLDINGSLHVSGISTFQDDVTLIGVGGNPPDSAIWDYSDKSLNFGNSAFLKFGSTTYSGGQQLQIYQSGSIGFTVFKSLNNNQIAYHNDRLFFNNQANNTALARIESAEGVSLYYTGTKRFQTSGIGATVFGQLDTTDIKATGITTTGTLNVGITGQSLVGITTILDEDNMASNSATALVTQQSLVAYVGNSAPGGSSLAVSADSGSNETINLSSEVLDIEGTANEIETATGTNKVVIGLPDNVSIGGTITVGTGATIDSNGQAVFAGITTSRGFNVTSSSDNGVTDSIIAGRIKIFDPGNQCQIQFGTGPSYAPHQKYASAMTYRTNSFTLQNTGTTRTGLSWVNADGPVNLWYTKGYAPDYSIKLSTSGIGITVFGQVDTTTLNTGDATFTGSVSAGSTTGTDGYYLKTTGIGVTWAALPSSRTTSTQTATAGQTSFNFSYNVGFVDVFVNGVKLPTSEFTASNGSTIVLDDAAFENDTLEFISLNTLPVTSGGGASNLTGLADVTITGAPVVGETLQHNGSAFVNDYTPSTTTTSTSQTAILSLPIATYRSAEYTIQITEGTKYHVTKVLAIHDGTNATFNEYGTLFTTSSLSTFALDVSSGNMRLLATPASTNSTVFKVKFTGIKV